MSLRWLKRNGTIIGCEHNGIEYSVMAMIKDENHFLAQEYHRELENQQRRKHERDISEN